MRYIMRRRQKARVRRSSRRCPAALPASTTDPESLGRYGRFYLHRLDIIDARSWRAILASGQHVVHRRRVAMEKRMHRAVTRVHDPAGEVPPFRLALDPGTKPDALHATANDGL